MECFPENRQSMQWADWTAPMPLCTRSKHVKVHSLIPGVESNDFASGVMKIIHWPSFIKTSCIQLPGKPLPIVCLDTQKGKEKVPVRTTSNVRYEHS